MVVNISLYPYVYSLLLSKQNYCNNSCSKKKTNKLAFIMICQEKLNVMGGFGKLVARWEVMRLPQVCREREPRKNIPISGSWG